MGSDTQYASANSRERARDREVLMERIRLQLKALKAADEAFDALNGLIPYPPERVQRKIDHFDRLHKESREDIPR